MQKREKHAQSCDPSISEKHPCPAWKDSVFRTCTGVIVITLCLTMVLPLSYRISWRCLSLVSICWAPWFAWIPCVGLWFQKILLNFFANCCRLLVFGTGYFHHFIIPSVVWPWKLALQHCEDKSELITIEDGGEIKDLSLPESIFLSTITVGDSLPVSLRSSLIVTWTFSGIFLH